MRWNKVKGYERQIDQMVYKLYDLNEEEIKIVKMGIIWVIRGNEKYFLRK